MTRALAATVPATLTGLLLVVAAAPAAAGPPLAPPERTSEVIVRFHEGAPASTRAAARRSVGASATRRLLLDDTQVLRVRPGTARSASRSLERLDAGDWAEPNLPLQGGAAVTDDPNFGELWGLRNTGQTVEGSAGVAGVDVNALPAWDTTRGAGIVVAVVDSGVAADHPDLQGNLWTNSGETPGNGVDDDDNGLVDDVRGWDFWDWDNDPDDFHSHGTHIAGTLAARANNQTGIAGVAPEAKVMPVRVLNDSNRGRTADLANGIAYAALNGADVINMSIGTPPLPDFPLPEVERDALDLAAANDALVVVAAMNDSKNNDTGHTPTWPCNFTHPNLICVAALDSDGSLSDFSNYGAVSVDVGAPGRSILSLSPDWDRLTPPGVEGFESDIAGRWYGNGSWARTTTFAASQAFSVTDSPAGNYANDTTPWIAMTNGVDLTGRQGCRINYAVMGQVLDGDLFVTGALNQWGSGYVATADTLETHGQFETWSDGISALDGDASARAVFELITNSSGTADGAFVDDVRFICRASNYDADSYFFNEGTSMATPHVAGVAALVRAAVPAASAAQVAAAIREGAVPMPSLAGKTVTGGRADAAAAIAAARRLTQPLEPQPSGPDNPGNPGDPGSPGDSSDGTPPRARVGRASVRGPFLLLSLSFPNEPGTVTGSVNLAKLQRGSARFQTRPGRAVVVKVRLRPAARRALASGARARAALTIRARDTAGNSSVTRSRIRLRAP